MITVGELIEMLKKHPPGTKLLVAGADSGGYDFTYCEYVSIEPAVSGGYLVLEGHDCPPIEN